jgi:26S proteasome regulatory subunit N3
LLLLTRLVKLSHVLPDSPTLASLLSLLPTTTTDVDMDVDSAPSYTTPTKPVTSVPNPEVETYIRLLYTLFLIDSKNIDEAIELSLKTAERIHDLNRRTLDPIAAKVYFYLSRVHEIAGKLANIRP